MSGIFTFIIVLVRTATPLLFGASLAAVAFSTVISNPASPIDLFAPYANLMPPGQPADDLESEGFRCVMDTLPPNLKVQCSRMLSEGAIARIDLTISSKIMRTTFSFYENRVTIGDLILLLGKPKINSQGDIVSLQWPVIQGNIDGLDWPVVRVRAFAQKPNSHFSYRNSAMFVTFEWPE